MIYGYARVSTDGQTVGTQVETLTAAGAVKVFRKTASRAQTNRAVARGVKLGRKRSSHRTRSRKCYAARRWRGT